MRVLMAVHSNYYNDARVRREAETLLAEGYDVTVIAAWPYNNDNSQNPYNLEGVNVLPIKLKRSSGPSRFGEMMLKMYRIIKNREIDIIHAHDADTLLPSIWGTPSTTPVIYDCHEWYPGNAALVGKVLRRKIWEKIEAYGLSRIHTLITVNESIKKLYKEFFNYEGESTVIRNFASIQFYGDYQQSLKGNTITLLDRLKKEVSYIAIYSGHLTAGRGLPHYLDAIRTNTNWGLIIAGSGSLEPWLQSQLESPELKHRVKFAGMLPHRELYPLIKECDVGLCYIEPISESYYYALPNKLSEYVQLGRPVIGSNLPEIASIINAYTIGYIADTPSQIAHCLNKITRNENDFSDSLNSACDELSWDKEKQVLIHLYKHLSRYNEYR